MSESQPPATGELAARLASVPADASDRAVQIVDLTLADAVGRGASDVHFEPTPAGLDVRFRIDGVLHTVARLPSDLAPNLVARLKVLSDLLTYRTDIPQEGAVRPGSVPGRADLRVSTFPTVHGEKAVARIFDAAADLLELDQLGLTPRLREELDRLLRERSGAILLTGPSGSGKTTTIYACLRRIVQFGGGRHVVTIEDPVERWIPGVSQSQVRPGTPFDFARGLRSLLRQDPDVILIGEIRDAETARTATEAALTGHLVFSTVHAGSACGVLGRLLEMGVEPYVITSGVRAILNQRLVRRVCAACGGNAKSCPACRGAGFRGRFLVAELLTLSAPLRRAILAKSDVETLERIAAEGDWRPIRSAAADAVAAGLTTRDEIDRVFGPEP
jgi:type II secretory ATPase GspE/PulE/Tfp pilus assembly ATPase PilB-like protein